jgi:hypothetical protein
MTRLLRDVLASACLLFASAPGCRQAVSLPMPDAMRAENLALSAVPSDPFVIRPASSGRIEFHLRDEQSQPVPDCPIDFSVITKAGGGTVATRLSTDRSLTDENGSTVLEVIVGDLDGSERSATFSVQAASQGASGVGVEIRVTANPYSVEILPVAAPDIISSGVIAKTKLYLYEETTCDKLDLGNPAAAPTRPLTHEQDPGASWAFVGISGEGSHAVVGLGLDVKSTLRVAGCLDLAGKSLLENQTMGATLVMDHLFPIPTGNYQLSSDITLAPVPQAAAAIQATWQEWARCARDPARLWLDCTIDALASTPNDPNDCVPAVGAEGMLGGQIEARRGAVISALTTPAAKITTTPCHDQVDSSGRTSVESVVDGLFSTSRDQLRALKLGVLASEIGTLLSTINIKSTMQISADAQPNTYLVDHGLTDLGFPVALSPISFKVVALGLPITSVSGLVATVRSGNIVLPPHAFTLRLGTSARFAFESTNLKSRNATDAAELIAKVFDLASLSDRGTVLTGCDALDAALSDMINQPRSSFASACRIGLDALATRLSRVFGALDGDDLDFSILWGTGSLPMASGVWKAEIRSGLGASSVSGLWSANSSTSGRTP